MMLWIVVPLYSAPTSWGLGIWHNSRSAADSRFLGPSTGTMYCGDDVDEPLDFKAHHTAEGMGLSMATMPVVRLGRTALVW